MAYAEKVPSPKGDYWRGRYKDPEGRYLSVAGTDGQVMRFSGRREAQKAADDAESDVRGGRWRDPAAGSILFGDWAEEWYAGLDLAASTMANVRRHLEDHLLRAFGKRELREIGAALIVKWEREEKAAGYAPDSIRTWRGTLHTCLEDAVPRHLASNPAARKRGRGKRGQGKASGARAAEKAITNSLGVLLTAERMSILTGRDDEFVMAVTGFWEALRLGELIGLEQQYARRPSSVRVEWQLSEVEGKLHRVIPKDGSRGDPVRPAFLRALLDGQAARAGREPCPCHGQAYLFRGLGRPGGARAPVTLREVAAAAGVSAGTVSNALAHPGRVRPATRARVEEAAAALGWVPHAAPGETAWHWRRSEFEACFAAAASGWLPARDGLPRRPVPLAGDWPGRRVRGRNAQGRAELSWLPVAEGLTPHGLRHSVKTLMEEQGIPEIMSEAHLRHEVGGVSGVYRHVTAGMRRQLAAMMTREWEAALDARLGMSPGSPVAVLDGLLRERAESRKPHVLPRHSPGTSSGVLPFPGYIPSDLGRGGRI